ncbi:MAG: hypothetical protein Q7R95_02275 [bacterium]|nr:hypothetical protein [bacterium]
MVRKNRAEEGTDFIASEFLTLKEQAIYSWIFRFIDRQDDKILKWKKIGNDIILFTLSGYNFKIMNPNDELMMILHEDETNARIIQEYRKTCKPCPILYPDANHPLIILNQGFYTEGVEFATVGQYALTYVGSKTKISDRSKIISIHDVLAQGWYKRALFSGSHTLLNRNVIKSQ